MLYSLPSTPMYTTILFFTRYGKDNHRNEVAIGQAVACLEEELGHPDSEKKPLNADDSMPNTSVGAMPTLIAVSARGQGCASTCRPRLLRHPAC